MRGWPCSMTGKAAGGKGGMALMEKEEEGSLIKAHGLSLLVAGVFLAGEMAGSGVLALPHAMVGTGRTT